MAEKDDSVFLMIVGGIAISLVLICPILVFTALFKILILN